MNFFGVIFTNAAEAIFFNARSYELKEFVQFVGRVAGAK